jgi:ferric-dicitrate binding protein FerR (iron transport regulator)
VLFRSDIICDKDISGLKCSGKMDLKDDLDDVLKGLSFSFPIKIEHINDRYNIKRNQ